VEEALDVVALAIDGFRPPVVGSPVGSVRYVGDRALLANAYADDVGIGVLVGDDDGTLLEVVEQSWRKGRVVDLAGRDQEPDRKAVRIDARVDFRGEASSASARTTISSLF
jgi:hypothetical protein